MSLSLREIKERRLKRRHRRDNRSRQARSATDLSYYQQLLNWQWLARTNYAHPLTAKPNSAT